MCSTTQSFTSFPTDLPRIRFNNNFCFVFANMFHTSSKNYSIDNKRKMRIMCIELFCMSLECMYGHICCALWSFSYSHILVVGLFLVVVVVVAIFFCFFTTISHITRSHLIITCNNIIKNIQKRTNQRHMRATTCYFIHTIY